MEDINTETRTDTACDDNRSESRFKILLFLIRFSGIPVNMKSVSVVNAIYNVTVVVCCYTITIFLHMDTYVHRHQLVDVMKKIRALVVIHAIMWAQISLRYAA
jgi:hypothetical protein